mmetsp:Transcript_80106/g.141846  ORF Transcript_80106/g.141846 Transcript_80106/m.141846 type:complete len:722 (+) Transcript_80106:81-2246(+)
MKCMSLVCVLALLGASSAAQLRTRSPVERVVNLLKELKGQIVADGDSEQKSYDKYACWCEKASSNKAIAIGTASSDMRTFSQKILTLKGKVATYTSEIAELNAAIKKLKEEQAELTSIRSNENGAYIAESTEMMQALSALQEAITVLRKATDKRVAGAELLQEEATARNAVQALIQALPMRVQLSAKQTSLLSDFASGAASSKYSPQSVTIQGMLADMYETFSADLETATSTEATANTNYETAMETKDAEIVTNTGIRTKTEKDKALAESELADTTETFDATYGQKLSDIKFFDETKKACMEKADEMTTRKAMRTEELKGIEEALAILTTDDARDLFAKAIKPGAATSGFFLQLSSSISSSRDKSGQLHAYDALKKQAAKVHSMRLAQLAASVRLAKAGHFDEVIKAINTMMQTLKDEDAADIAKRDGCKANYKDLASYLAEISWDIEKNEANIAKLDDLIKFRAQQKEETIAEIAFTDKFVQDITTQRNADHDAWKAAKKDDEDAIALLSDAIKALSAFYSNHSIALGPIQGEIKGLSFQQQPVFDVSNSSTPDATLSDMGVRKDQSKNAISILTMIKQDLENEIMVANQYEEQATATFLAELKTAAELRAKLVTTKDFLIQAIADRGEDKVEEQRIMNENILDREAEEEYKAEIKPDCDFIIRTFTDRATKRAAEVKGLTDAKEYLVGANYPASSALLEKKASKFDDSKLPSIGFLSLQ